MKKKMSNRDKKILYIFGAIVILAATYFLGYSNLKAKTETIEAENATLNAEVERLDNMAASKDTVIDNTEKLRNNVIEKLEQFPLEVRTQNIIAELHNMYNEIEGVKIQSESYKMNQIFYQQGETPEEGTTEITTGVSIKADTPASAAVTAASGYMGYRSDVVVAFTAKYGQLQDVITYINDSETRVGTNEPGNRMTITDLAVTKDASTEVLNCTMTVSMYAISGTAFEYQQPEDVGEMGNLKNDGIFGK